MVFSKDSYFKYDIGGHLMLPPLIAYNGGRLGYD